MVWENLELLCRSSFQRRQSARMPYSTYVASNNAHYDFCRRYMRRFLNGFMLREKNDRS